MEPGRTGFLLLLATLCLTAQRSGRPAEPDQPNPLGRSAEVVEAGKQLYNKSCTMCHGLDGTAGDRAPALAARRRYLRSTNGQLFDAIKKGIPGTAMPALPLSDDDVWKIVGYVRSLRATAVDEFVQGDVKHGESLFDGKAGCQSCHMIRGRGGLLGPDLSNIGSERSLAAIRSSLTEPAAGVPKGFQPVRAVTNAGAVIDGLVKNEDNFSLQVMDRKTYDIHLLVRSDLKDITYSDRSLMPHDYQHRLTKDEMQDLLAYLSRQVRGRRSRTR